LNKSSPQPQTSSSSSGFENIKRLNACIQKDSDITALSAQITSVRKKLDVLVKNQHESFKVSDRAKKEQKKREAYEQRVAERQQEGVKASGTKMQIQEKSQVEDKIEPKVVEKESENEKIKKPVEGNKKEILKEKGAVDTKPIEVIQIKENLTKATDVKEVVVEQKNQTITHSSKASTPPPKIPGGIKVIQKPTDAMRTFTPSYIKGRITPSPKPIPQPKDKRDKDRSRDRGAFNKDATKTGTMPRGDKAGVASRGGFASQRPSTPNTGYTPQGGFGANRGKSFGSSPSFGGSYAGGPPRRDFRSGGDDRRGGQGMNKRTLIRKGFVEHGFDDERIGVRKLKNKKKLSVLAPNAIKIEKAIITTENLTVKILSEKIGKTAQEILKQLMKLGIMTTINSVVDFDTMELVASELGVELELKLDKSKGELLEEGHGEVDNEKDLVKRPPIITVMGHVDHGKTSLLDRIRSTNIVAGEAGGITQAIGAYSVAVKKQTITFLDTPGHEAFTQMRARGASVTDIAILVVAADDGIMPQTIEAISHAKAAKVPVLVAINKIDKPGANIDKVKQMLTEHELVAEEWGGDTMMCPISAKFGEGVDKLLESILLLAEVHNFRANPKRLARASVVEAKIDKGRGPIANVVVLNGTLKVGDTVVAGTTVAKVRAMTDDKGKNIKVAGPSTPVSILGFTEVPNAGDTVLAVADEKVARQVAEERIAKQRLEKVSSTQRISLDDLLQQTSAIKLKDLNLIIKADVKGSAEALKDSLSKLSNEEAKVNVVHSGVGNISKTDIMLAEVSNAVIFGFNVKSDSESKQEAEKAGIEIKNYKVIYEAIDDTNLMLKGMLTPRYNEVITGKAEVRNVFKITGSGQVCGSYVTNGKIYRNSKVRVWRGEEVLFEGSLRGLKRFKEDVKDVAEGYECGISIEDFSSIKEGDILECYHLERVIV